MPRVHESAAVSQTFGQAKYADLVADSPKVCILTSTQQQIQNSPAPNMLLPAAGSGFAEPNVCLLAADSDRYLRRSGDAR